MAEDTDQMKLKAASILQNIWKGRKAYLFLTPLFVGLIIFCYYPPVLGIYRSFFDWNGVGEATFIGLDNFKRLLHDKIFLNSIPTMAYIMLPRLLISIVVPLVMAELIFGVSSKKAQSKYRIAILLPIVAPGVVGLLIWKSIFDPASGLMTAIVKLMGFAPANGLINWLGDPDLVIFSIVFMGFPWIGGTSVLIYMSGLMNISGEVIESAKLDGANTWHRIRYIDLPLLTGQIKFFLIFGIIGGLQDYGTQIVLTSGGPGYATYVPGYYMYTQAFSAGNMGYASAIGTTIFVFIFVFTLLAFRMMKDSNSEANDQ